MLEGPQALRQDIGQLLGRGAKHGSIDAPRDAQIWVFNTYRDMKNDICLRGRRQISRYTAIYAFEYDFWAEFVRYIAIFALKFT